MHGLTNPVAPRKADIRANPIGVATADRALDDVASPRVARVTAATVGVAAAEATLNNLARPRTVYVTTRTRAFDTGTPSAPRGGGIAAERGPEIINRRYLATEPTWVPGGTHVTSRRQTERVLRTNGHRGLKRYDSGGTVPNNPTININAAVIGNRFDVMRAVKRANMDAARLLGTRR